MAKFGVNVVVLVDNMPLVFFYFSPKPFKKKFLHSLYYQKKIRTKLPTKKKNSCRGNFSTPLPGYLMVHPLIIVGSKCVAIGKKLSDRKQFCPMDPMDRSDYGCLIMHTAGSD